MFSRIIKMVRNNVLVGFFLTVPIAATILIFNFVFDLATEWVLEYFDRSIGGFHDVIIQTLTLCVIVIFLFIVGLLVRNIFGRQLYRLGDKILTSIPFIKGIYRPVTQISESLFTQRKTLFKEVVLVQYPRKGLYSLAFVTAAAPPSVSDIISKGKKGEECISLFISTTPNPTSGVFILVPKSEVTPLNMPVSDALTFIMSAGAVAPGDDKHDSPTLLDKLEVWLKHETGNRQEEKDA